MNGKVIQNNTYDGDGKRIEMTQRGSANVCAYKGSEITEEKSLTSNVVIHFDLDSGTREAKNDDSTLDKDQATRTKICLRN